VAVFEKLEVEDLYAILKNPNNPITLGKKKDFKAYGIDIQFEDEALYEIAVRAGEEKTGARGLVSAVEKVLLKYEKRLPSTDIRKFVVTPAVVENPDRELEQLLRDPTNPEMLTQFEALRSREEKTVKESILSRETEYEKRYGVVFPESRIDLVAHRVIEKGYDVNTAFEEVVKVQRQAEELERDFERKLGISLRFNDEAIDRIIEIIFSEDRKGTTLFSRLSKDYEYGLELIREKTGQKEFTMPREAVDDPEGYLNQMIRDIYSRQSDQRLEGKG